VTLTVCTIVRGRRDHFAAMLRGLEAQLEPPDEISIAYMQPQPHDVALPLGVAVVESFVPGDALPLAEARNAAASRATSDALVFLDVDCVPSNTLVRRYRAALDRRDAVFMGEVFYLPPKATLPGWRREDMAATGLLHPVRPNLAESSPPAPTHDELWSLSFGIRAPTWRRVGGMDVGYEGYGGEDTDFGMRLKRAEVPMAWLEGAACAHQYHPVRVPPLQHFDGIVRNAQRFRARWGRWCMDYWLDMLERDGYIERTDERIRVRRRPTDDEIEDALLDSGAPFG